MGRINRDWHAAHPMPERPTEAERVAWHVAHSAACGCRRIKGGVKAMLEKHGYRVEDGKVCASN
jgi:hypothetical protein